MVTPEIMHLYLLNRCRHKCPMCCNILYNIDDIPIPTIGELQTVHTLCCTGGEPFLVDELFKLTTRIRKQYPNIENLYSYTSGFSLLSYMKKYIDSNYNCLEGLDGVTISPKDMMDWNALKVLTTNPDYYKPLSNLSSNRIYIFTDDKYFKKDEIVEMVKNSNFNVIERYWDSEFKTPENEIFRRLPILLDK